MFPDQDSANIKDEWMKLLNSGNAFPLLTSKKLYGNRVVSLLEMKPVDSCVLYFSLLNCGSSFPRGQMAERTHGLYSVSPNKSEVITWRRHKHNTPMRRSLPRERQPARSVTHLLSTMEHFFTKARFYTCWKYLFWSVKHCEENKPVTLLWRLICDWQKDMGTVRPADY